MTFTIELDLPVLEMSKINRKKTARKLGNWSAKQTRRRIRRGRYRDGSKIPEPASNPGGRPLIRTKQMVSNVKARIVVSREQVQYMIKSRGYRRNSSEKETGSSEPAVQKKGGGASKRRKKRLGARDSSGNKRKSNELIWNSLQKHHANTAALIGVTDRQIKTLGELMSKEVRRQLDTGEFWKHRNKRLHLKLKGRAGRVVRTAKKVGRMIR